ncbi:hypothetical protein LUZ60_012382 [Juncus effusus]|nr:hypothetical protein LUZ60_012382 [Juncus effusus]
MEGEEYKREESVTVLVIVILAALSLVSLLLAFSYYCYISHKVSKHLKLINGERNKDQQELDEEKQISKTPKTTSQPTNKTPQQTKPIPKPSNPISSTNESSIQIFTYKTLHNATLGFSKGQVAGRGSFGSVYKGELMDGRKIAVKCMDRPGNQGENEFKMEVELLTRLKSPYLLGLIGHCSEGQNRLLVYEFMANGGLQEHLYPTGGGGSRLDWETRLRIALQSAKGLEFLHEHTNPPIIHRDFKTSNILLGTDFDAKVSDFGLAKLGSDKANGHVSTRVLGTQGYVAPEYALTGHLTTKSDVYSFGVVLLELLTGRIPVDMKRPPGEGVLVTWALPLLTDREKVVRIMDPALEGQYSMKDAVQVAAIAAMCVQPEADYRPLMADVVQSLVPLVKMK